jgi:hypothetical protein
MRLFVVAAVLLVLVLVLVVVSIGVGWAGMIGANQISIDLRAAATAEQKKQKKAVRSFLTESRCFV